MPGPPALSAVERAALEPSPGASLGSGEPVVYTSLPRTRFPVPPVQVFGLRYDFDLVLVSDHPDYVMHELARVSTAEGPVWIAKDSGTDREQCVVSSLPGLQGWAAEVPVPRVEAPLVVSDESTDRRVRVRGDYVNCRGSRVSLSYDGPAPTRPASPRNGNTMGHSRGTVAAVLDLFRFRGGGRAQVVIDEQPRKIVPLLGVAPQAYALAQVQGGFAVVNAVMRPSESGFQLTRPAAGAWPTAAVEDWAVVDHGWVERPSPVATLLYHFVEGELDRVRVTQGGATVTEVVFSPRLPDVRRAFSGRSHSTFAVDVNGERGHGTGSLEAWWEGDVVRLALRPTAPRWFADRPMSGTISFQGGEAELHMERVNVEDR